MRDQDEAPANPEETTRLIEAMRDLGVSARAAGALLTRYGRSYLWRMVRQTRYARRVGAAGQPARWFLASVRNHWKPPAGFDEWAEMTIEEYQEALCHSWGICRRCWSRPCRCSHGESDGGIGNGIDEPKPLDREAGQVAVEDGILPGHDR